MISLGQVFMGDDGEEVQVVEANAGSSLNTLETKDALKIVQLRNRGLTYKEISKALDTSESTCRRKLARLQEEFAELNQVDEYEATKADLLSAAEYRLLKSVMDKDLSEEKISSIVSAFDKLFKARRVQTNQSTDNVAVSIFHSKNKDTSD